MNKKILCDNCGEIDHVLFDGYDFGERTLEDVQFKAFYSPKGKLGVDAVDGWDKDPYLKTLKKEHWQKEALAYITECNYGECPKCGEEVEIVLYPVETFISDPRIGPEVETTKITIKSASDFIKNLQGRSKSIEDIVSAQNFHDIYERLAPEFGYQTREDTKIFDPNSPNGKLMIAVCNEILSQIRELEKKK